MTRSLELNQAVLETEDMAAPPSGSVYELWLRQDDELVPAGFMPDSPDNQVLLSGDAATADAVGITVEPAGGSPTGEPTTEPIALFSLST